MQVNVRLAIDVPLFDVEPVAVAPSEMIPEPGRERDR